MKRTAFLSSNRNTWIAGIALSMMCQAHAKDAPSVDEITKAVSTSVDHYASAIACARSQVEPKDIAALKSYRRVDAGLPHGLWAVVWSGDIGCEGGSASASTNIAIVAVHLGNEFLVEVQRSSPSVTFDSPVSIIDRIVSAANDTLVLEGRALGPKDALCCASERWRFTMTADGAGNWRTVAKQRLPDKT